MLRDLEPPQDQITRIDDPIYPCRVYECGGRLYPSVTSVLAVLDDMQWYKDWVGRVGQQKADDVTRVAGGRGALVHLACQDYVSSGNIDLVKPMLMPDDLYRFGLVKQHLMKLEKVRAVEHKLICQEYQTAGTADLIAYHEGALTVIDYKTSNREKHEDSFKSFWFQTAFYAIAWNETYPAEPVEMLGIIPVNDIDMVCKPRFLSLSEIHRVDLRQIRDDFRVQFSM